MFDKLFGKRPSATDTQPKRLALMMPWGRVGSNLLVSQLKTSFSSKRIRFANEPLNRTAEFSAQLTWFRDFYTAGSDTEALVGSKHAIRIFSDRDRLADLFAELGLMLVRQRRANFVKVAVSQLRAKLYADHTKQQTGRALWGVYKGQKALPPLPLDAEAFLAVIGEIAAADEILMAFAPDCHTYDLEYETLKADPGAIARDVLAWLELTPDRESELRFDKATPDRLAEAVPNLEELRKAALANGFADLEPMFDE